MTKVTLNNVGTLIDATTAQTVINANNDALETAIDNTLSLDGTAPNAMLSTFDMNSQQMINLPAPATNNSPLRLQDLTLFTGSGTITNLPAGGTTGQVLAKTSGADYALGYTNSVTSVGLSLPADFTVTGSPVTTTGTLTGTFVNTPTGTGGFVRETSPTITTPTVASLKGGTATNSTATISSTSNVSPSGDSVSIQGSNVTLRGIGSIASNVNVGVANTTQGQLTIAGSTSGSTIVKPSAIASGTLTLPAVTDTLVGKATTDTLTNKTFDTAGTGNSFSINSLAATANTGTGSVVRATSPTIATATLSSPTLTTPALGVATATSVNGVTLDTAAWTSYTPTVTSGTGTLTSVVGVGAYKLFGKTCCFWAKATITTNGTGATRIDITLPFTAAFAQAMTGANGSSGVVLSVSTLSGLLTKALVFTSAGLYPGVDGWVGLISGVYETT